MFEMENLLDGVQNERGYNKNEDFEILFTIVNRIRFKGKDVECFRWRTYLMMFNDQILVIIKMKTGRLYSQ